MEQNVIQHIFDWWKYKSKVNAFTSALPIVFLSD